MLELHLPWLELAIVTPLIGAAMVIHVRDAKLAWRRAVMFTFAALCFAVGGWQDFNTLHTFEAHDRWDIVSPIMGAEALVVDELSAPLIPLAALLFFLVTLTTMKSKHWRFPFAWNLVSLSLLLALLSCRHPWGIIVLMTARTIPPWFEMRARGSSTRVFTLHMLFCLGLMVVGWMLLSSESDLLKNVAISMLTLAVLIRSGSAPLHCWMPDLIEKASLGTALLFVAPMSGAYAAVRLVLPIAPDWALQSITLLSLATAVYAAGMALVQNEARRFFCYLFLSHTSLVLVGLEVATPISLTGGLCVWLSAGISLAGLGLTLRALEARSGRLSLADYHGLYEHVPGLAAFFLLTGLASIGFPGTIGFIGAELLVEGVVGVNPLVGVLVVFAAALNSIAVLQAYFKLFTGTQHTTSISLKVRWREQFAMLLISALILGGGLIPQPGVSSRYHAASEIIARHEARDFAPRSAHQNPNNHKVAGRANFD